MRPVLENLGALIIDEVSMVGPDLIDCIDLSLRKVKGNDRPFGGVPIIMVGDILQLPPVVRDKEVGVYFTQFPLTLGWAITIHKSQGMTMDQVRIDLGKGAFCTGQTYVALSRCRTMGGIILSRPLDLSDV